MMQQLQHVNYYRHALLEGAARGFVETGRMTLILEGGMGAYLSPVFDAGGPDGTYNRLVIEGDFAGARLEVIVAATNSAEAVLQGRLQSLEKHLSAPGRSHAETVEILTALPHARAVGARDILLHGLTGRYLWIYLTAHPTGEAAVELEGMRLELPRVSFTQYFPELYQGNEQFARYIAIFQSLYLDRERRVDEIPARLDYTTAADGDVEELARWLGIDNEAGLFSPDQLRRIIRDLDLFQGRKGTAYALPRILELLTGIAPRIVEHFQWEKLGLSPDVRELYGRLYGATCDDYCVIFDLTDRGGRLPVPEEKLERIVADCNLTGARCRIVYLRPECRADTHCYMDVNSVLATPEIAYLDEAVYDAQNTVG